MIQSKPLEPPLLTELDQKPAVEQSCNLSAYTRLLKDLLRFWLKVDIKSDSECWEFKPQREGGYGDFKMGGKCVAAHRFAYWLANGQPEEMPQIVRHKCDNPPCCNPHHLVGGTHADNVKDRVERCRSATGERNKGGRRKQCLPLETKKKSYRLSDKRRQKLIDMGLLES